MAKCLLLVYHSQSARTTQLALAAWQGACEEEGVVARLLRACDASSGDVLAADALVLLTPENCGAAAGGMKDFLDRVFYPLERAGRMAMPYALVIAAGNDGTGTSRQLERILSGLRMARAQPDLVVHGVPDGQQLEACRELGRGMAAGLLMGVF